MLRCLLPEINDCVDVLGDKLEIKCVGEVFTLFLRHVLYRCSTCDAWLPRVFEVGGQSLEKGRSYISCTQALWRVNTYMQVCSISFSYDFASQDLFTWPIPPTIP